MQIMIMILSIMIQEENDMKFSEMSYKRPDLDAVKAQLKDLVAGLANAQDYAQAKAVFLKKEEAESHIGTLSTLAHVRHTIDTRDKFYDDEMNFWNSAMPELQEYNQEWKLALLKSPFRADFEAEFGNLMFLNAEIELKTFSPEIIPELQNF